MGPEPEKHEVPAAAPAPAGRLDELVTERQREILRHALGLSQSGREYRNRYYPGGTDITDCQKLMNLGMMERHEVDWIPDKFYTVTAEGKRVARAG